MADKKVKQAILKKRKRLFPGMGHLNLGPVRVAIVVWPWMEMLVRK